MRPDGTTKQNDELVLCLLPLLEAGALDLEAQALAGDIIAASSRFNLRVASQKSNDEDASSLTECEKLVELYGEAADLCRDAVAEYRRARNRFGLVSSFAQVVSILTSAASVQRSGG